jgi:hypothetical protein
MRKNFFEIALFYSYFIVESSSKKVLAILTTAALGKSERSIGKVVILWVIGLFGDTFRLCCVQITSVLEF